jgi:hypothetical protein
MRACERPGGCVRCRQLSAFIFGVVIGSRKVSPPPGSTTVGKCCNNSCPPYTQTYALVILQIQLPTTATLPSSLCYSNTTATCGTHAHALLGAAPAGSCTMTFRAVVRELANLKLSSPTLSFTIAVLSNMRDGIFPLATFNDKTQAFSSYSTSSAKLFTHKLPNQRTPKNPE